MELVNTIDNKNAADSLIAVARSALIGAARRITCCIFSALMLLLISACDNPRSEGLALGEERSTSNEAQITTQMISAIKQISIERHAKEEMKRFNQSKTIACFDADFQVDAGLSPALRQGIFAKPRRYKARLRFANATKYDDREKDFRGLSISVFGVAGEPLWGTAGQQDFLLNSHPVLFARDGSDFLEFIEATREEKLWQYFVLPSHFYSLKTVLRGREKITNPFAIRYWSTTPFRHGADSSTAVKYSVAPCTDATELNTQPDSEHFFAAAMQEQLAAAPVCLNFMVQQQTDPEAMPIEDASVLWNEQDSPFQSVATIMIQQQDFRNRKNQQDCEDTSFNPWQSIAAHQPLGDINRMRKAIYAEMARARAAHNEHYDSQ